MFGLNNAQLIGRLGADVTVNHLANGGRVANLSIATDESYIDKNSGDRVVTFQPGLVEMFEKHARKGRLVYVAGKLQTPPLEEGRRGLPTGSRPRSFWSPADESSSWTRAPARTATRHPRRRPPPRRRWPTRTRFRSKRPHRNHNPPSTRAGASPRRPIFFAVAPEPTADRPAARPRFARGAAPSGAGKSRSMAVTGRPGHQRRGSPMFRYHVPRPAGGAFAAGAAP